MKAGVVTTEYGMASKAAVGGFGFSLVGAVLVFVVPQAWMWASVALCGIGAVVGAAVVVGYAVSRAKVKEAAELAGPMRSAVKPVSRTV